MTLVTAGLGLLFLILVGMQTGRWGLTILAAMGGALLGSGLVATLAGTLTDLLGTAGALLNQLGGAL